MVELILEDLKQTERELVHTIRKAEIMRQKIEYLRKRVEELHDSLYCAEHDC